MKKLSVITIFVLVASYVYLPHANAATINLKFASFFPPVAPQSKLWDGFCEEVQKRTNGAVKIFFYPGGSLIDAQAMAEAIQEGIVDIGYTGTGFTPGRFPVSEATIRHGGYPNAYIAGHVGWDFYNQFKPKEWENCHMLSVGGTGPMCIWSTKRLSNLEEISGQKLRGIGPVAEICKLLAHPQWVHLPGNYTMRSPKACSPAQLYPLKQAEPGEWQRYASMSPLLGASSRQPIFMWR